MHKVNLLPHTSNGDIMLENIMSKKVIMAKASETIKEVSEKMLAYDIGFLPVVSESKLVGVITDRDIATSLKNINSLDVKVEDYMTKNIISIDVKKSIKDVLKLMKKEHVKRIVIKDKQKLVGVVSLSDIIAHYIDEYTLMDTMKSIFTINRNSDKYETEIDEFYL